MGMEIKAFYDALGELCRAHGARKLACDDCPAACFCYTAPGSVTETMPDGIKGLFSTEQADALPDATLNNRHIMTSHDFGGLPEGGNMPG